MPAEVSDEKFSSFVSEKFKDGTYLAGIMIAPRQYKKKILREGIVVTEKFTNLGS